MKNGIAKQIMSGYGDLRKSEKKAADYILKNMEQAAELSIDRLAEAAKVSQPTVLRMLRAFGFSGYKDFKYQLVSELAQSEDGRSHQESASDRYLQCGEFRRCGAGSAGEASLSRPAVQIFQRFLLSEDLSGKPDG